MSKKEETNENDNVVQELMLKSNLKMDGLISQLFDVKKELTEQREILLESKANIEPAPTKLTDEFESSALNTIKNLKTPILAELNIIKNANIDDRTNYANFLQDSEARIEKLSEEITKVNSKPIKMLFLAVIISSIISVIVSIYAASYMMQTFPTRVIIDKPENIILYDSDVSLWGTENVKILKGLKKNPKKNSKKL